MLQLCSHLLDGNQQQKWTHWSTVIRAQKNSDEQQTWKLTLEKHSLFTYKA